MITAMTVLADASCNATSWPDVALGGLVIAGGAFVLWVMFR